MDIYAANKIFPSWILLNNFPCLSEMWEWRNWKKMADRIIYISPTNNWLKRQILAQSSRQKWIYLIEDEYFELHTSSNFKSFYEY